MSKIELPPEPSAAAWRIDASYWTHRDSIPSALLPPINEPEALFTADQLRARDRQIVELCASLIEARSLRARRITAWMNGEPIKPCEDAAAIRSLLDEKK